MEGSGTDCFDWLVIYDGSDQSGNKIGRYCGVTLPGENGTIYSNSNQIFMSFRSDHSIGKIQFLYRLNQGTVTHGTPVLKCTQNCASFNLTAMYTNSVLPQPVKGLGPKLSEIPVIF